MVIISINPIQSIFWLVLCFLFGSSLLINLNLDFIPLILIIIYVGSIVILFLFIIMMLDLQEFKKIPAFNIIPLLVLIFIMIFSNSFIINYLSELTLEILGVNNWLFSNEDDLFLIGSLLYNYLYIPLIIITLLLLVALVGVIILGLETSEKRKQDLNTQQRRNNSWI